MTPLALSPEVIAKLRAYLAKRRWPVDDIEREHDAFMLFRGMGPARYLTSDGRILIDGDDIWEPRGVREHRACGAKQRAGTDSIDRTYAMHVAPRPRRLRSHALRRSRHRAAVADMPCPRAHSGHRQRHRVGTMHEAPRQRRFRSQVVQPAARNLELALVRRVNALSCPRAPDCARATSVRNRSAPRSP